jgi:hypothetical protein
MTVLREIGYGTEIRKVDGGEGKMKLTMIHRYEKEGFFASLARGLMGFLRIRH